MSWKFNHDAEAFAEAVGISRDEIPQTEEELFEALMSGDDRDLVRAAVTVFFAGEEALDRMNPEAIILHYRIPEEVMQRKSKQVENIYRVFKRIIEEQEVDREVFARSVAKTVTFALSAEAFKIVVVPEKKLKQFLERFKKAVADGTTH